MSYSKSATMVATLALLTALVGCSKQSDTQSTSATAAPAAAQPTVAAVQPAADATAQPQSAATLAAASNAGVASSDGDLAGTKFVVNSLARGSDALTLKFTLVNDAATPLIMGGTFYGPGYNGGARDVSGIHLLDTVSKKKYFVLADTDGICVCSQAISDIKPNSQAALWAKFPAPPPSVTKITIDVPHFIPLENVPISQ